MTSSASALSNSSHYQTILDNLDGSGIHKGYQSQIRDTIKKNAFDPNERYSYSQETLLCLIAGLKETEKTVQIARSLLALRADFTIAATDCARPPLILSVDSGNLNLTTLLLAHKADVNSGKKSTPLTTAAGGCHAKAIAMFNFLLESKANPSLTTEDGYSPLHSSFDKFSIHQRSEQKIPLQEVKVNLEMIGLLLSQKTEEELADIVKSLEDIVYPSRKGYPLKAYQVWFDSKEHIDRLRKLVSNTLENRTAERPQLTEPVEERKA